MRYASEHVDNALRGLNMSQAQGYETFDLTGKSAFVTGGSMGLGYAMARALARYGAKVMLAARREGRLQEAAEKLVAEVPGAEVSYIVLDLAIPASVDTAAAQAISKLGGVDIFVGNAALEIQESIGELKQASCAAMFQANVTANLLLTQAFAVHMRERRWGRVILSSSVMANLASPNERLSTYTSVKGALDSFTYTAAAELGRDGITVNSLNLGVFVTEMSNAVLDAGARVEDPREVGAAYASMTCLGRFGKVEDIEGITRLLASDAGAYITGANLAIDGGLSKLVRPYPLRPKRPAATDRSPASSGSRS